MEMEMETGYRGNFRSPLRSMRNILDSLDISCIDLHKTKNDSIRHLLLRKQTRSLSTNRRGIHRTKIQPPWCYSTYGSCVNILEDVTAMSRTHLNTHPLSQSKRNLTTRNVMNPILCGHIHKLWFYVQRRFSPDL